MLKIPISRMTNRAYDDWTGLRDSLRLSLTSRTRNLPVSSASVGTQTFSRLTSRARSIVSEPSRVASRNVPETMGSIYL